MSQWLSGIPLFWGKIIAVVGFIGMIIWTWRRPKAFIMHDAPDTNRWRDLRIWATVCLGIQIILYFIF